MKTSVHMRGKLSGSLGVGVDVKNALKGMSWDKVGRSNGHTTSLIKDEGRPCYIPNQG